MSPVTHKNRTHEVAPIDREGGVNDRVSSIEQSRLDEMLADPIVSNIPLAEQHEAVSQAFELYLKTKEFVAPVIVGFADELLREAGDTKQIVFAARDGLGPYVAAQALRQKFPDYYKTMPEKLSYAYFTRKLMRNSTTEEIREYVTGLGINPDEPTLVADIGMFGSIQYEIARCFADAELRYLISRNWSIPGYLDDGSEMQMRALDKGIMGNPVVHFMEDTFSGPTGSASRLVRQGDKLVPDVEYGVYEPKELLKRVYAIKAFEDYVAEYDQPPRPGAALEANAKLDEFLCNVQNFQHLMVPHISG
ncbi:hypothetical protein IPM09_03565 [Candidatus Saccharibacteria bacterium]|nr:MAG: hypothetical protein IPM09_03565 [Candidatus Saccharibacteria bacterium]